VEGAVRLGGALFEAIEFENGKILLRASQPEIFESTHEALQQH